MAKKLIAALTDTTVFLQEWFANPQRTGSLAPSSPQLGAAMAQWLPADPESYVLELGPGTGAVTEALIKRGLREDRLVAIERNPKLARLLREKFPRAQIIIGDAWQLDHLLQSRREPIKSVGAVISSLPLLNFPLAEAEALAEKSAASLSRRATGRNTPTASTSSTRAAAPAQTARFQDCLVQFPARPRQRVSEVTFPASI